MFKALLGIFWHQILFDIKSKMVQGSCVLTAKIPLPY